MPTASYSPKRVEALLCELRHNGVLKSSTPRTCSDVSSRANEGMKPMRQAERRKGGMRMPRVRDKMVSSVVSIEPGTGVVDAAKRMIDEEKGPLPIVEGERPVAIVTDRDIIAHVVAEGRDPKSMTVHDIASHDLVTIGPDEDIDEARRLMDEHELDRILVVEDDRLVGIISEADIRSDEGPLSGTVGGVTDTVGGVTEPVRGVTDTVRGTTDKLLGGGGGEK